MNGFDKIKNATVMMISFLQSNYCCGLKTQSILSTVLWESLIQNKEEKFIGVYGGFTSESCEEHFGYQKCEKLKWSLWLIILFIYDQLRNSKHYKSNYGLRVQLTIATW